MYDEALLKELTELENTVRFDSFDFNDAYALGSALRAALPSRLRCALCWMA